MCVAIFWPKDSPSLKPQTKQINIGSQQTRCKCLCGVEATEEELEEALKLARKKRLNIKEKN